MCFRLLQLAHGSCNRQTKKIKIFFFKSHIWAPNCVETVLLHWIGLFLSPKFANSKLARPLAF